MNNQLTAPVTDEELDQMIWKLERDGMTPKQLSLMRELRELRRAKENGRDQFEEWMLKKWGRERQEYDFAMGKFLQGENYADSYTRHMWKAWSASRAAMQSAGALTNEGTIHAVNSPVTPDGWVMVPIEPTAEMRDAYHNAQEEYESVDGLWSPDHQWKAMIAAAPQNTPALNSVQSVVTVSDGWIPVSERMPPEGFDVLCASEFDGPGDWRRKVGYWNCGKWFVYGASWKPTHWQPLPAAPKEVG